MTSPAWVWVARFELAISRFQTERSRQVEPHPDGCRLRRKGSNLRRADQSRVSYPWTTPERSSLRKESNLRTRAYEARHPPRSAAMQNKAVTRKEETLPAALPLSYRRAEPDGRESNPRPARSM